MRKAKPSVATRTEERASTELPLPAPALPPPAPLPERRPADRIKEALIRWLEGEM